jgi:EAL domain-containing protein (putative c-di-GMP-specific phosphodiesterase class I)
MAYSGTVENPAPASTSAWSKHPGVAAVAIVLLLLVSWAIGYAIGGAGVAAPHWFYVPIAIAASRFGYLGAAVASIAAGLLAGPLLPLDVAGGVTQTPVDWVTRASFFVGLGQFLAWLIARQGRIQRDLHATKQNVSVLEGLLERQNGDRAARWRGSIEEILARGGPNIVFQPVVELSAGTVQGVEALSRFDIEPIHAPDFWFDAAWKTGLGLELELAAVRAAVRETASLPSDLFLAVNLSPQVAVSASFQELLPSLPLQGLVVEITEHAEVEDYQELAELAKMLRKGGGRLAIDDVGAGFASLRHILRLDPDVIKLDVSLTRGVDADRRRRALASGLVSFAAELGCSIVSEGIETEAELEALRSLGVRYGQGYFLSRPSPLGDLELNRQGRFSPQLRSEPVRDRSRSSRAN